MKRLVQAFMLGAPENQKMKETSNIKGLSHQAAADSVFVWVVFVIVFNLKNIIVSLNDYQIKMVKKTPKLLDSQKTIHCL